MSCSSALLLLAEPGPYSYPLANPRPVEAHKSSTSELTAGQVLFLSPHSTNTNPPVPAASTIEDLTTVAFLDKTLELAAGITKDPVRQDLLRTLHAKTC